MASLVDMLIGLIAALMSAAFLHFGASDKSSKIGQSSDHHSVASVMATDVSVDQAESQNQSESASEAMADQEAAPPPPEADQAAMMDADAQSTIHQALRDQATIKRDKRRAEALARRSERSAKQAAALSSQHSLHSS